MEQFNGQKRAFEVGQK